MFVLVKSKKGRPMLYQVVDGKKRLVSRAVFVSGATAAQVRQLETMEARSARQQTLALDAGKPKAKPKAKRKPATRQTASVARQAREVADRAQADAVEAGREARKAKTTARKAKKTADAAEKVSRMPLYGWS
jgi:hypothetical protein